MEILVHIKSIVPHSQIKNLENKAKQDVQQT